MRVPSKRRAALYVLALRVLIGLLAGAMAGCTVHPPAPPAPAQPSAADMSFDEISNRYLHDMLALTPVAATALGEHRYDGMLDDVSVAGNERRTALAHELLTQLKALDRSSLSRAHQLDAQLLTN